MRVTYLRRTINGATTVTEKVARIRTRNGRTAYVTTSGDVVSSGDLIKARGGCDGIAFETWNPDTRTWVPGDGIRVDEEAL